MELKEGMYCYDKVNRKLGIGKILLLGTNNNIIIQYKNCRKRVSKGNIEASNDITDLIEVGDVLLLLDKEYDKEYKSEVIEDNGDVLSVINFENDRIIPLNLSIYKGDIKLLAIVTKEQFNLIKYEV